MSEPSIIGINLDGTYVFQANLHPDRVRWYFTRKDMYVMGVIHGGVEAVVVILLKVFPDIYRIDYRDDREHLHMSYPAQAQPNELSRLVAKELTS